MNKNQTNIGAVAGFIGAVVLLSGYALASHYFELGYSNIVDTVQYSRHQRLLAGDSPFFNPWQYRVLTTYAIEAVAQVGLVLGLSTAKTYFVVFMGFRFLEHLLIFGLAYLFYRKFTPNPYLILFSFIILSYAMSRAIFDSDLSFSTYLDVIFFLLAAVFLWYEHPLWWFVPLSVFAAFNRETAVLIPLFLIADSINWSGFSSKIRSLPQLKVGIISLTLFMGIFVALRAYYGYPQRIAPDIFYILWLNCYLGHTHFWTFGMFNILPLLTFMVFKELPPRLKTLFWVIIPIWFVIHYSMTACHESRLFLVPTVMVFMPAALVLVERGNKKT
ncbi:MAG: hypothetical protein AB8B69_26035 [Chitinophagales bacterium]